MKTIQQTLSDLSLPVKKCGHLETDFGHLDDTLGIVVFMSKKSLRPTFEYSWGGGVKCMFLPLISRSVDPVCFNISPLYQIISSHQFHQLSYYIPHFKRELCKDHVRDPEVTRLRNKHLLSSTSSELTCNFSAANYRYCTIRKCKKMQKIIYNVF